MGTVFLAVSMRIGIGGFLVTLRYKKAGSDGAFLGDI